MKAGRHTKYSEKRVAHICQLIESDDYTIGEVCRQVGIHVDTFFHWKNTYTEFSERVKKAEEKRLEVFKAAARSGLLTLLRGKEYEEVTTELVDGGKDADGNSKPKLKMQRKIKKFIMPNPVSVIFTLKNLDAENFADILRQENRNVDKDGNDIGMITVKLPEGMNIDFPSNLNDEADD